MLKTILVIVQIAALLAIAVLLWQILRKFKAIPEDEIIGEERAKYLTVRLNILMVCVAAEAVLSIVQTMLRLFLKHL
ncbi:MAG: hypothetical protein IKB80_04710 [Oscillospiraceae bacterium]|nr:hypothetical protein [Oscillospiraceae bacterium]